MNIKNYIKTLTSLSGVSGFEYRVSDFLVDHLKNYCTQVNTDSLGNVIACKKSAKGNGKVMLEAHIDEIGMIVKSIDENGFLLVSPIGGIDPRTLLANTVIVHGKNDYVGIIGAKPPHMMSADEYAKVIDFKQLYIDVGMTKEQAEHELPVGSVICFESGVTELLDGHISSKCLDDRAAVAILLDCIDKLSGIDLGYDLYVCACVQEEVGLRGSVTAAYEVNPDFAVAIDVTHAATPDESKGTFKCGCGPVVCVGPNIHPILAENFVKHLKASSISYEIEVEGGNTGTDAWSIQTAREGIPTMLLSLPLKYMHTPVETMSLHDCEQISLSLSGFLKSFERTEDALC